MVVAHGGAPTASRGDPPRVASLMVVAGGLTVQPHTNGSLTAGRGAYGNRDGRSVQTLYTSNCIAEALGNRMLRHTNKWHT